ncbi:MAG: hypothetical protein AB8G18_04935 [Gammaproteobacteria bacterium]
MHGDTRVVSNKVSTVKIGPWELLRGESVKDWLTSLEELAPDRGELVSSKGVISESVPGAYSVTRKARFKGKNGLSVLYACPGPASGRNADDVELVKLLTLDVTNGSFLQVLKGALFGEKVCKDERRKANSALGELLQERGLETETESATPTVTSQSQESGHGEISQQERASQPSHKSVAGRVSRTTHQVDLARLNDRIPTSSRPTLAYAYLDQRWAGFPAQLTYVAQMKLKFLNGNTVYCADWDPVEFQPTAGSVGKIIEDCEIRQEPGKGEPLKGFSPGETIDIRFGNISAEQGFAGGSLHRSDLAMTRDGRIAINNVAIQDMRWRTNFVTSTRRSQGLVGRYYLNGYTITVETDDGDVVHGFTGYRSEETSRGFDHIYINGEHFWDRDK